MQHRARSTRLARIVRGLGSIEVGIDEHLLLRSRLPIAIDDLHRAHAVRVIRVITVVLRQSARLGRVRRATGNEHRAERARARPSHTPPPDRPPILTGRLTHRTTTAGHDDLVRLSDHLITHLKPRPTRPNPGSEP